MERGLTEGKRTPLHGAAVEAESARADELEFWAREKSGSLLRVVRLLFAFAHEQFARLRVLNDEIEIGRVTRAPQADSVERSCCLDFLVVVLLVAFLRPLSALLTRLLQFDSSLLL